MQIDLDYDFKPRTRWTPEKPHTLFNEMFASKEAQFKQTLLSFLALRDHFFVIQVHMDLLYRLADVLALPVETCAEILMQGQLKDEQMIIFMSLIETENAKIHPTWCNYWIPAFDALTLYSFIALNKPKRYVEIGSGNSTKFASRAIKDHELNTTITSIDPDPRACIDLLCDVVIRCPLEEVDQAVFKNLEPGDILFFDGSHRCFTNNDVTVFFLEIIPQLKPGVLIQVHDICLPFDYSPDLHHCYYSEQYILGAYLLGARENVDIILPNAYITSHSELSLLLDPIWNDPRMKGAEKNGSSFWFKVR